MDQVPDGKKIIQKWEDFWKSSANNPITWRKIRNASGEIGIRLLFNN
jgi:hypothetical protein